MSKKWGEKKVFTQSIIVWLEVEEAEEEEKEEDITARFSDRN